MMGTLCTMHLLYKLVPKIGRCNFSQIEGTDFALCDMQDFTRLSEPRLSSQTRKLTLIEIGSIPNQDSPLVGLW